MPVFGNDSGEPCHDSTFASSWCQQGWRWNLDMVVDPHGGAMTYFYEKETNYYGLNMKEDVAGTAYHRGGYLKRIDYGQRSSTIYSASAPAQVVFETAERCEPGGSVTCAESELNDSTASYWRDVPYDQNCNSGEHCTGRHSPTFWSRKRLTKVTTQILRHATDYCTTTYCPVDSWALTQSYPPSGDGSRSALWLGFLQHSGHRSGTVSLPSVSFTGVQLANRVFNPDGQDGVVPLYKRRMQSIVSEAGGEIRINYKATECSRPDAIPSAVDNNGMRCFPQHWAPDGEPDRLDWFHKYVVEQVVQNDLVAGGDQMITDYEYVGNPAWHYDDDDGITPAKRKTWSQYRGYAKVKVRTGAPGGTRSLTETHYFRGMDGDKQLSGTPRDVTVTSTEGHQYSDHWRWQGRPFETTVYDGSTVVSKTINKPWLSAYTARRVMDWGTKTAYLADTEQVNTYTALDDARGWRRGVVEREFDSYGIVTQVTDWGEIGKAGDETCTKYEYARNTGLHMLTYAKRVEAYAKACGATVSLPEDFISHAKTFYDDLAAPHGTAPTKGDVVKVEEVSAHDGTTATFQTVMTRTHDALGRETATTNADGKTTTTVYTDVGGLLTSVTTTNALGHTSTTHLDPAWGVPQAEIDTNGQRTDVVYDALGRVSKVWFPGQIMGGEPFDSEFIYNIRNNGPSVVTTRTQRNDGTYGVSYELYDGWLRSRQTQLQAPGGTRLISDTLYDSRGLVARKNANYANQDPATTTLFIPNGDEVPSATYTYNPRGQLLTVTDPTGANVWRNEYDLRGRTTTVHDPDKGATQLSYDVLGRVATTTDARNKTLAFTYDALSRKTGLYEGSTAGPKLAEWTYDTVLMPDLTTPAKGYPASSTRYQDGVAYTTAIARYDDRYRPTRTTLTIPTKEGLTTYSSAGSGTLAGSRTTYIGYNYDGTLASTRLPAAGDLPIEGVNHTYSLYGMLVRTQSNLSTYVTNSVYSNAGLLLQQQLSTGATGAATTYRNFEYDDYTDRLTHAYTTQGTSSRVTDVRYGYDSAGNITSVADTPTDGTAADKQCFDYDYLRRLSTAWTATGDCATEPTPENAGTVVGGAAPYWHSYSYDVAGNRTGEVQHGLGGAADTTRTYTTPVAGASQPHTLTSVRTRIPPVGPDPGVDRQDDYVYDASGNTVTRRIAGSEQTLSWDAEGRLASVAEGGNTTSFVYDADGNRLLRKDASGTTLYMGQQELFLSSSTGTVKGTRYILHGGQTVAVRTSAGVQWLIGDHQGTAQLAVNAASPVGSGVQRRYQSPFGVPRGTAPVSWPGDKGFVGGTVDASTGLTHLGAREYDPAVGRFVSVDPVIDVADPQQMHGYAYANNSPITFADPDGLSPCRTPAEKQWCEDFKDGQETRDDSGGGSTGGGGNGGGTPSGLTPQEQQALALAQVVKKKSLMQVILETGGAILLDVIGVTDIYNCVKGSIGSCLSTVAGAFPWYKVGKGIKAVYRAAKGVLKWIEQVKWADNVIKAAGDKIAKAEAAAAQAAKKADDVPDVAGRKQPTIKAADDVGAGGSCVRNSFTPDTGVLMADGSSKPIEDVKVGDEVIATGPETGKTTKRKVVATIIGNGSKNLVEITVNTGEQGGKVEAGERLKQAAKSNAKSGKADANGTVIATDGHPFWVQDLRAWVKAADLKPGMWLRTGAGTYVQITAVRAWTRHQRVHNLTVNDIHTYYVQAGNTPVLVHNCGDADDDLLDFADAVMRNTDVGPGGRPATASKITSVDGQVRFATSADTRTGSLPEKTARAIADADGHGGCAEINCAAALERGNIELRGSTVQTVKIGGGGWKNGKPMWGYEEHGDLLGPCPSCQRTLPLLGIRTG